MEFDTKFAIVVAEDLLVWQKLNVVAFLSSGIVGDSSGLIGEPYRDGGGRDYLPMCVQPVVVLRSSRERLKTFLNRANNRGVKAAVYIEDMFVTGFDRANRETVGQYQTEDLPLVGIAVPADRKETDKVLKGAKLHQ